MDCKYPRFAVFLEGKLSDRNFNIGDAQVLCVKKVHPKRWYCFLKGTHIPTAPELKHIEHRMAFNTPDTVFECVGSNGEPIKSKQLEIRLRTGKHVWTF